ncbi:C2H2-type zinc finger transcription factor, partial [Mucor lusitanicus]
AEEQQKIYSFVPLDVIFQQKRPRKKFNEVERLYACTYMDCTKAYGTLNHLNAHVTMQGHGPKRMPIEFKELRRQLKKNRKK